MFSRWMIALLFSASAACSTARAAEEYPTRPIRIVVGFAAGGAADVMARVVANSLQKRLGQPVIVENKPGAGGEIAAESVIQSRPDGYSLHFIASSLAINSALEGKQRFDIRNDLAPVASIVSMPNVLFVNLNFPAKNFAEFIAYARANPGKINLASPGTGTTASLAIEVLNTVPGVSVQHISYRSNVAVTDVISGQVHGMYATVVTAAPQVTAGKVRAIYVTSTTRSSSLPDVPSASEVLDAPGLNSWFGLSAPRGTPAAVIDKLSAQIKQTLAEPEIVSRFDTLGGIPHYLGPAEFGAFVDQEMVYYTKALKHRSTAK